MSRYSCNFCIDEHRRVRHVEFSCFDDPESGEWGMTYKSRYSDTTFGEAMTMPAAPIDDDATAKKRKRCHLDAKPDI